MSVAELPDQLTFDVGGEPPSSSSLLLRGGALGLPDEFEKGSIAVLQVEVRIDEVDFIDKVDGKTGMVVGCERKHKGKIVGRRLLETRPADDGGGPDDAGELE